MYAILKLWDHLSHLSITFILVSVGYVSKWVEAATSPTNDFSIVCSFLKKHIFTRFGTPMLNIYTPFRIVYGKVGYIPVELEHCILGAQEVEF